MAESGSSAVTEDEEEDRLRALNFWFLLLAVEVRDNNGIGGGWRRVGRGGEDTKRKKRKL